MAHNIRTMTLITLNLSIFRMSRASFETETGAKQIHLSIIASLSLELAGCFVNATQASFLTIIETGRTVSKWGLVRYAVLEVNA